MSEMQAMMRGSAGEAIVANPFAEESTEDQLKATIAALKADNERLQRHSVSVEMGMEECQAALLVTGKRLGEHSAHAKALEVRHKLQVVSLDEKLRVMRDRLRSGAEVDRGIQQFYLELRRHTHERLGAPPISTLERDTTERATPLVLLSKIRLWMRRVLDTMVQQRTQGGFDHGLRSPGRHPPTLATRTSPGSIAPDDDNSSAGSPNGSFFLPRSVSPRAAADADERIDELKEANLALEARVKELEAALSEKDSETFQRDNQSRITTDLARREAANARQEVRKRDQKIEELTEQLRKGEHSFKHRLSMTQSRKEVAQAHAEAKKIIDSKNEEIEALKRHHVSEMRIATDQLSALRKHKEMTRGVRNTLRVVEEERDSLKQQIVRTNVKGLNEEKQRMQKLADTKQERIDELEREASNRETTLRFLENAHAKMTEDYTSIFEAHYRNQVDQAKRRRKAAEQQAAAEIKGPNSEINLQYYRTRYNEVLEDLKKTQRKMKQLILLSHHDQLSFQSQREVLESQLVDTREELTVARAASQFMSNSGVALNVSNGTADDTFTGQRTDVALSFNDWKAQEEAREAKMVERDEDLMITSPSVIIAPDESTVSVSVPALGSDTGFGSPMQIDNLSRITTTVENPHREASTRTLAISRSAQSRTASALQRRNRSKKVPLSEHGNVFDFQSVGEARQGEVGSPGRLARPASAMSSAGPRKGFDAPRPGSAMSHHPRPQ